MLFCCSIIRSDRSIGYCIPSVLILFFTYNFTVSPAIYWNDSPEFSVTAYTFGIGHPSGFPAYSLISKIFTFFPYADIAVRVNHLSLFFAVSTGLLTFYVITNLIRNCFGEEKKDKSYISASLGVLILGFANSFWWMASISELYTLNCFLLSIFFLLALKWYQTSESRFLFLATFIFGISTAVYGANLLFVPALITCYFLTKEKYISKKIFIVSIFFLLGYSIHLYLPVRSLTNPTFDWGNPETFTQFMSHITDRKDSAERFSGINNPLSLFKNSINFIKIFIEELTLAGLFLTIIGAISHFKKDIKSFCLFASIALINTLFFMTVNANHLFLVSFLIFATWIGLGIYTVIAESSGYIFDFKYKNIAIPITISFIVFSFAKDYSHNNKSSYYLPRDHAAEMYLTVDQNALIISSLYSFHFEYLRTIEFLRPDVTIINLSDMLRPDLFNPVTQKRMPMISFPVIKSTRGNQHQFIPSLISNNINRRPIYWDLKIGLSKYNYQYLTPGNKFLMRFHKHKIDKIPNELLDKYYLNLKNSMLRELDDEHFFIDHGMGVRSYYYAFLKKFVDYLMMKKMYHHAQPFLDLALTITDPDNEEILALKGACYMNSGNLKEAEEIFLKLYKKDSDNYANIFNLASLYFGKKEFNKAEIFAKKAINLNKDFIKSYFLLGQIHEKEDKYDQAIKEMNYAIKRTNFMPDKKRMQNALNRVKRLKTKNSNLQEPLDSYSSGDS